MYTCIADNHGRVTSQLNPLKDNWRQLGQQFCIPDHEINAIDEKHRGRPQDCLKDTVAQWMEWNFTANVKEKKVKSNVDWLIRAVKEINPAHADKLEKGRPCNMLLFMIIILLCIVYEVTISGLEGHSAQGQLIHIKINTYKHCIIHYYG